MDGDPTTARATCYRHPNREAPIACTRCERPICLDDAVDGPVGYLCPECSAQPRRVRRAQRRVARAVDATLTKVILGVVVVAFLAQQSSGEVFRQGALFGPAVAAGEWWRIVTGGFLHSGLIHVGFNGYLLWLLGKMIEPGIGAARYGAIYVAGLFGGAFGALLLSWDAATVGASGAVFGLMGAAMIGLHRRGINPWQTSIGTLVLLNLAFTFLVPNISIGGHVGGLLGGAAAAAPVFAMETDRRPVGTALAWIIAGALGVAAVFAGAAGPLL